ncbi:hypothetical protein [uncultured Nocardioides sp.]|uniref:hypothetical protein n=1 Tax=uncultured Nocardioides sp. TaxID=198441 RepID=UPI0025CCD868|nr:hypothetical protein [uncultured Nocardioides sp.]
MFGDEKAQRRRNARDLERRMRELDELDRRFGLGALPGTTGPREVRRTRHGLRNLTVVALTLTLVGIVLAIHPSPTAAGVRALVGSGLARVGVLSPAVDAGSYAFIATQPGTGRPVGYDPCTPITVAVNPDGAPGRWRTLVDRAIENVGSASGLDLVYAGQTDSRDMAAEETGATVLVMWATEDEVPALKGDVAGVGGSSAVQRGAGRVQFVRGQVVLDREAFDDVEGLRLAVDQAVVDHELAHVVGLDHVDDPGELMNPRTGRQLSWGPGDLEGLARLGDIPCG